MAAAEVGDEQYLEDPTVNELQRRIADLLGHEAALFLPTATMANEVALRAQTTPGRSEEHTSELQSQSNLVCRLLLEKKNDSTHQRTIFPTRQPSLFATRQTRSRR